MLQRVQAEEEFRMRDSVRVQRTFNVARQDRVQAVVLRPANPRIRC